MYNIKIIFNVDKPIKINKTINENKRYMKIIHKGINGSSIPLIRLILVFVD